MELKKCFFVLFFFIAQISVAQEKIYPLTHKLSNLIDPKNSLTQTERDGLSSNLNAAVQQWAQRVYGLSNNPINIAIEIVNETDSGRTGTRPAGWEFLYQNEHGFQIFESCASFKLRTGQPSPHCPDNDILMFVQLDYFRKSNFIDPDPSHPSQVPQGKVDLVTVLAHELAHGFGMAGGMNLETGETKVLQMSIYDSLIQDRTSDHPTFIGAQTQKLLGSPMPVYKVSVKTETPINLAHKGISYHLLLQPTQNLYHYGRFTNTTSDSDETFFGLLAGTWVFKSEARISVGEIDFAILKDLGIPVK